jgi:uncharacterized SAM-binding protein YcdF (DUF218 family)
MLLLFGLSYWFRGKVIGKYLLLSALSTSMLFTNPFIYHQVASSWQVDSLKLKDIDTPYDVGIVLGGYAGHQSGVFALNDVTANRLTTVLELYLKGKIKKILLSGGNPAVNATENSEAIIVAKFLMSLGVPEEDILVEPDSRNTMENARFSAGLLEPNKRCLLITSDLHMKRAIKCFERTNIQFEPFAADIIAKPKPFLNLTSHLPSAKILCKWGDLTKEIIGLMTYKIIEYA